MAHSPEKIYRIKEGMRGTIEVSYKLSLEEFLNNNPLGNEVFFIRLVQEKQKTLLENLKPKVNFFNIELKEDATQQEIDQWDSDCVLRDEFWFFREYQLF